MTCCQQQRLCGFGCFQKVVWARQSAPNMSDMEGPQRVIPFPGLKVWRACQKSTNVMAASAWGGGLGGCGNSTAGGADSIGKALWYEGPERDHGWCFQHGQGQDLILWGQADGCGLSPREDPVSQQVGIRRGQEGGRERNRARTKEDLSQAKSYGHGGKEGGEAGRWSQKAGMWG